MKSKYIYSYITVIVVTAYLIFMTGIISCQSCNEQIPAQDNAKKPDVLQRVQVMNLQNVPLRIPVHGEIIPWKQAQLMVPFKSKIIASLAEPAMKVRKNDLLVSLWRYSQKYEYTPLNLLAPFDGIVSNYQYKVGDEIPANQPILTVKNYEYYSISIEIKDGQQNLLKKWAKTFIKLNELTIEGYILNIFPERGETVIRIPGTNLPKTESAQVNGYIEAGNVSGTFISDHYFGNRNTIQAVVDPDIEITLIKIGLSDSLAYVYPGIPDQNMVTILPPDYDL